MKQHHREFGLPKKEAFHELADLLVKHCIGKKTVPNLSSFLAMLKGQAKLGPKETSRYKVRYHLGRDDESSKPHYFEITYIIQKTPDPNYKPCSLSLRGLCDTGDDFALSFVEHEFDEDRLTVYPADLVEVVVVQAMKKLEEKPKKAKEMKLQILG